MNNVIVNYILGRLREPSTWAGAAALFAVLGRPLPVPVVDALPHIGAALAALLAVLVPDRSASLAASAPAPGPTPAKVHGDAREAP